MALFNKGALASFFGLAEDDEFDYDSYQPEQETYTKPVARPSVTREAREKTSYATNHNRKPMARKTRTAPVSEVTPAMEEGTQFAQQVTSEESKVVSMRNTASRKSVERPAKKTSAASAARKITIVEPRVYSEAMTIAKRVITGEAVLVNFHLIEEHQARRIVDFLTGTVYALDGDIQRVGDEIFLCTPENVEIDSSTAQTLAASNFFEL